MNVLKMCTSIRLKKRQVKFKERTKRNDKTKDDLQTRNLRELYFFFSIINEKCIYKVTCPVISFFYIRNADEVTTKKKIILLADEKKKEDDVSQHITEATLYMYRKPQKSEGIW